MRRIHLLTAAVAILAIVATAPALAITYGQADVDDRYPAVGALLLDLSEGAGTTWVQVCTGALIADDVVLTAAHCTDQLRPGDDVAVTFDATLTRPDDAVYPQQVVVEGLERFVEVTGWSAADRSAGDRRDPADVALLDLAAAPPGIAPLPVAADFFAGQKPPALRAVDYINVGYGAQEPVGGTKQEPEFGMEPGRRWSLSGFQKLDAATVTLSQKAQKGEGGTCYGDSGGPVLASADGQLSVVAIVWSGDRTCERTNVVYRLDTPASTALLTEVN